MAFQIIRSDITKVKADAIVNTANPHVAVGGGVDAAIYRAAGRDVLLAERKKIGILPPGNVAVTPAFHLDATYIIHVSGPWWVDGTHDEVRMLCTCYEKALEAAKEKNCASIAFPLLATGTYGFPKALGLQIAVDVFTAFLQDNEMEITLVVFGSDGGSVSGELGEEVRRYMDDHSVEPALEQAHGSRRIPGFFRRDPRKRGKTFKTEEALLEDAEADWPAEMQEERPVDLDFQKPTTASTPMSGVIPAFEKKNSLDDVLKNIYTDSFEKHLQQLIHKKGFKNSEVYAAANISKQYFSKLLKGKVKPSKEKVLALAVGLRLNLDETVDFLRIAGYALSPISQTDAVVEYFIQHQDYNVIKIDIVLFDYGLEPLSNA
ncbi:MAG: macro domain-containing protein [Lachnospiraceae bacterium]|nr:macro domain-containing protein [Lachnospiraceae bacterium]